MADGRLQIAESISQRNYGRLIVWQKAKALVVDIYRASSNFPNAEAFGLTAQLRRAAISVPANIAEGQERQHRKEFLQFLYIAKGSLAELEVFIVLAVELNFLNSNVSVDLLDQASEVGKLLNGLINSLKPKSAPAESLPSAICHLLSDDHV